MSSDYYIDLSIVLSQPEHFELGTDYNVGIKAAVVALNDHDEGDEPDWDWVKQCLEPTLTCIVGGQEWYEIDIEYRLRDVSIVETKGEPQMHICCAGTFRTWFISWMAECGYPYITAEE
jgi:hypothetical protein